MSMMSIRTATARDREAIRLVEEHAFGQKMEAGLVDALVDSGDTVLELVAEEEGQVVGHILFSRLYVEHGGKFAAVALAPLAVEPSFHGAGIGRPVIFDVEAVARQCRGRSQDASSELKAGA